MSGPTEAAEGAGGREGVAEFRCGQDASTRQESALQIATKARPNFFLWRDLGNPNTCMWWYPGRGPVLKVSGHREVKREYRGHGAVGRREGETMRFTADYDSEEEEFPVSGVKKPPSPSAPRDTNWSSDEDSEDDDPEYIDTSWNFSPKANRDAWVTNKPFSRTTVF